MSIIVENESLCAAYQSGDAHALDLLVEQNTKLVAAVASSIGHRGKLEFEDLMQEGNIALIRAAQTYRPDKGCSFSTYAWKIIERKLKREVGKNGLAVRPPANLYEHARCLAAIASEHGISLYSDDRETINDLFDLFSAYEQKNGREIDRRGFEKILDCLRTVNSGTLSLDYDLPCEIGACDDDTQSLVEDLLASALSPRERLLISMRFGLSCDHSCTLAETSRRMGISRERVRQIEQKSLSKLRLAAMR